MADRSSSGSMPGGAGGKSQQARQEAGKMGHEAQQAAGQVAHQAANQGNQVMTEGRHQARNLASQASAQLREQAGTQQKRAADRLRAFGTELGSMANKTDQHGIASDMVQRASDAAQQAAGWLEEREPGALVDEVRDYARRRPGAFLAGAVVAGLVVGRLTRGLAAGSGSSATGAGDPAGDGHRRDSAEMPPSGTAQPEMAQSGRVSGAQTVQTPDAGKGVAR